MQLTQCMRRYAVLPMAVIAFAFAFAFAGASCGGGGGGDEEGGAVAGCLGPAEVREEFDRIAEGVEASSEEVEAKQEAIRAVEGEAC